MNILLLLLICFSSFSAQLVVFTGDNDYGSKDLRANILDEITKLSKKHNVKLSHIQLKNSSPKDLKFLPSIYFQNYRGRSLYLGRYNNLAKIEKFIQSSRFVPQDRLKTKLTSASFVKKDKMKFFTKLKVTELAGALPPKLDNNSFRLEAIDLLKRSFTQIQTKKEAYQETGDRTYYFDIYPWLSSDNKLSLSYAIYSQFDCHTPVFSSSSPITGALSDKKNLFSQVALLLESQLGNILKDSTQGDAVRTNLPLNKVTWKSMKLSLPKKPSTSAHFDPSTLVVTRNWSFTNSKLNGSAASVFFNFPAPLEHYSGQIKESKTTIRLNKKLNLQAATGLGEVSTLSIDMGNSSLNDTAMGYISAQKYPKAKLVINDISFLDKDIQKMNIGEINSFLGEAVFHMKGQSVKVLLKGEAGLIINQTAKLRLYLNFKFTVNISEPFDISGPDSSVEANKYMNFNIVTELEPTPK